MGHLFWQPTPVLVLSILQFHLKLLVRYGQIPITIMRFFLLPLCQHLSCSGGILEGLASSPLTATLPPPCTSLSCLTLEYSCYFCIELEKFLPNHLHLCQTLWQWQVLGWRWKRLNWWKIQIPGRDFFFTWFGGDMGRNCLGAWASGEVASLQPVAKKRVWFIYSYVSNIKYLSASTSRWTSPWAVERAEKAARASPKLGGVAGVFEGVPQGGPAPPGL